MKLKKFQIKLVEVLIEIYQNFRIILYWHIDHIEQKNVHVYREDYVSYLENYIKVDIYGSCGNLECTPEEVSNYSLFQINPFSKKYSKVDN